MKYFWVDFRKHSFIFFFNPSQLTKSAKVLNHYSPESNDQVCKLQVDLNFGIVFCKVTDKYTD